MTSIGLDVGPVNFGIGVYDGRELEMSRVNYSVEKLPDGTLARFKLTPALFIRSAEEFVADYKDALEKTKEVGIEVQMR